MIPSNDLTLNRLAGALKATYGGQLYEIIFFGSRARGDAALESDYDCLLVFREVTPALKRDLDRLASDWLLESGIVFSWVAISKSDLERFRYEPFIQNARREGIIL